MANDTNPTSCAATQLEDFLEDLRATTGVSPEFLEAARPIVSRLFTDIDADQRPELEIEVRRTVSRHARMEMKVGKLEDLLAEPEPPPPRPDEAPSAVTHGLVAGLFLGAWCEEGDTDPPSA